MKYEVTIVVDLHPEATYYGTEDELDNVYSLIEAAVLDVEDLKIEDLEVREHG